MGRIIFSFIALFAITLINGCGLQLHNPDDPRFLIVNNTQLDISFNSYNLDGSGFASEVIIVPQEGRFTGGGGILGVDSVLFVKKSDNDSIVYRNERHGDDILSSNHFFNFDNWVEKGENEFYYSVNVEDFDN